MEVEDSNCTFDGGLPFQTLNLISFIPLFIFGITCNVLALWIFCCKMQKWTVTTLFMMNLIVADILIVSTIPFRLYAFLRRSNLEDALCKAIVSIFFMNMYVSIFTITAIAFDRYLAIRHPLRYKSWISLRKASITCCIFWVICIVVCVVQNLAIRDDTFKRCFQKNNTRPVNFSMVLVVVGFLLPLLAISFCSGKVIMTLRVKTTMDTCKPGSVKKAVRIVIAGLVSFVICFLPVHVGYTIRFVAETFEAPCYIHVRITGFIHVANVIANSNCVLDSMVYYFAASEIWDVLFKQKCTLTKCKSSCVP
ncbi:G-protein coupled receptor 35-like [Eleutherodactylus coqui]|uniref:G-protein coupled receptor 35-like n=1 Tax=Eleutherodactylus coqui TaxID=57060 RepID=UPI00346243FF